MCVCVLCVRVNTMIAYIRISYKSSSLFFQKIKINLKHEIIRPRDPSTARAESDLLQVSLEVAWWTMTFHETHVRKHRI